MAETLQPIGSIQEISDWKMSLHNLWSHEAQEVDAGTWAAGEVSKWCSVNGMLFCRIIEDATFIT